MARFNKLRGRFGMEEDAEYGSVYGPEALPEKPQDMQEPTAASRNLVASNSSPSSRPTGMEEGRDDAMINAAIMKQTPESLQQRAKEMSNDTKPIGKSNRMKAFGEGLMSLGQSMSKADYSIAPTDTSAMQRLQDDARRRREMLQQRVLDRYTQG